MTPETAEGGVKMQKIKKFFVEVRAELLKVSWPSKDAILASTIIVVILSIIIAIYVGVVDVFFSSLIRGIIR